MKKSNQKKITDPTEAITTIDKKLKDFDKQFKALMTGVSSTTKFLDTIAKKLDAFEKRMEILGKMSASSEKALEVNKKHMESMLKNFIDAEKRIASGIKESKSKGTEDVARRVKIVEKNLEFLKSSFEAMEDNICEIENTSEDVLDIAQQIQDSLEENEML